MRKWVKLTIWLSTSLAGFLVAAFLALYIFFTSLPDMCGNQVFKEIYSPGNKYKAVVFQRDCGATTGFSTQVSVINSNEILENEGGNAYIADNHPNETKLQLTWLSERSLEISNSDPEALTRNNDVKGVSVTYK
ncbi:MAG: DUF5412 family protein [Pseudomonadales bacterium]